MRKYYLALLLSLFSLNTFANCPDWVEKDMQGEKCSKAFKNMEEVFLQEQSVYCPSLEWIIDSFEEYKQTVDDMKSCLRNRELFEALHKGKSRRKKNGDAKNGEGKNDDKYKKCVSDIGYASVGIEKGVFGMSSGYYLVFDSGNNRDLVKSSFRNRGISTMSKSICSELSKEENYADYSDVVSKAKSPKFISCEADTSLCNEKKFIVAIGPFSSSSNSFGAIDVVNIDSSRQSTDCKDNMQKIYDVGYSAVKSCSLTGIDCSNDGVCTCGRKKFKVNDNCSVTDLTSSNDTQTQSSPKSTEESSSGPCANDREKIKETMLNYKKCWVDDVQGNPEEHSFDCISTSGKIRKFKINNDCSVTQIN
ncbi:MAG: hypothetical protein J6J27_03675 [Alphaproteobacteria bacterium]|nr:hypothetical protein [Alphaproteobacteria bacterium]